jgi:hypothetical protein
VSEEEANESDTDQMNYDKIEAEIVEVISSSEMSEVVK